MSSEIKNTSELSMDISVNLFRYKMVFVGDVSVGKTSIINTLVDNKFANTYDPTIGVDFFSKTLKFRGKSLKLQIWDSAGQEKYRSLIPNYVKGSSVVFIVYDISKYESFNSVEFWVNFIREISNPQIILVANKIDLSLERKVPRSEAEAIAKAYNLSYFEVSAKTGENMKNFIYLSIANLSFFDQYDIKPEDLLSEIEKENGDKESKNNLSILDSSRGTIQIHRSEITPKKELCKC